MRLPSLPSEIMPCNCCDPGIAFPPAFMGVVELAFALPDQRRLRRVSDIIDLMAFAAEHPQQIGVVGIALGQCTAVADARHLRTAVFVIAGGAWNMREISRMRRISDVHDRGTVEFGLSGQPIDGLRDLGRAAMVADISDISVALVMDCRLVGAAALEVVVTNEPHIHGLGRSSDLLLRGGAYGHRRESGGA